jgi:hypothetical protein
MKILKANCEQIALIESALYGTGWMMRVAPIGSNVRTMEVQTEFKSVCFTNDYELQCKHGLFPVKLEFHYNLNDSYAHISTNRKGLDRLREIFPDTFAKIEAKEDDKKDEQITIEVKPHTKLQTA